MKSNILERQLLTRLEKKLLDEVIRPSLTSERRDHLGSMQTTSETVNFGVFLEELGSFYRRNGGKEWGRVLHEECMENH